MQITPSLIYLINLSDNFIQFIVVVLTTSAMVVSGYFVIQWVMWGDIQKLEIKEVKRKSLISQMKKAVAIFISLGFLTMLIPSKQTWYEILVVPQIANSKIVADIPGYITKYLDNLTKSKE